MCLQPICSTLIRFLSIGMDFPIQFDDQLCLLAVKVNDILSQGNLSVEFMSTQVAIAQYLP